MPLNEFKATTYPAIKDLTIRVKKKILQNAMSGELVSSLKGRGIEFEDFRDYTSFDDAIRIDWRASQKSQRLLVREYKIDINFNVFFIIDTSESMLFASTKKLKCEYASEVVNSIFYGLLSSGNSVGFGLFNGNKTRVVKPLMGKKQFHLYTKEITNPENYGGKKDFSRALQHTLSILDRKALVFLISDFIDMSKELERYLKIISQVHEVIGIMIRDPRDIELPKDAGQILLQDPNSDEKIYIDAKQYSKLYNEYNAKQLELIRTIFHKNKSKLLELRTDQRYFNPLLKFFTKIGARWR